MSEFNYSECNGVTMDQLHEAAKNFQFAAVAWRGEYVDSIGGYLALDAFPPEMLYAALRGGEHDETCEHLSAQDKLRAAELAIVIRPEQAQWLYHFAVLVTKIA